MYVFGKAGKHVLQRVRKGHRCGEHLLWKLNCLWFKITLYILYSFEFHITTIQRKLILPQNLSDLKG